MQIALYQPDIPQNLGSILRLCACLEVVCHIIEPCGFILDDKRLKRVAMDYTQHVKWQRHASWEQFIVYVSGQSGARLILLTTKGTLNYCNFQFRATDILLMGRESAGVPQEIADATDAQLRIPLSAHTRSLNIAQAASMALGEAIRQTKWVNS